MLLVQIYNSAKFTKLLTAKCLEKKIYLWSLRYEHEGRAYELWLERKLVLQPEFEKRDEELPNFISFYWGMKVIFTKKNDFCINEEYVNNNFILYKCLLEETTDTMLKLQEEHNKKLEEYNCSISPMETLGTIVNPSILKLTEKNDKAGMYLLGPFFTNVN